MPEKTVSQATDVNNEIESILRRQDKIEEELENLRKMYNLMKEKNKRVIDRVHDRIDKLEKELTELRQTLDELKASVSHIQKGVSNVQQHVSDINSKQDFAIKAQDKFIGQLWKAFFVLLSIISAAVTAIVTLLK
ncbi:hypothetical protein [Bacillus atrophaeus]|uniref:hypothetical protein n=1 Tax=Bacillus atrophaeus TaxID=1452 RepID=UPI001C11C9C3|nr:hypothetical protein [Bacillus atrophaeus]MBU5262150.1 hypothetical protein [Bacillus atrophaeus]MCY8466583.1 hypothetical protein [Bacillus atrophaeus]MCY8479043.1 hypothetical protein [Bacillus atrophaeus]